MSKRKETILLVEDSDSARITIASLLEQSGYRVLEAEDGQVAIDIYRKERKNIDAIVSDLQMPNVDGFEFARFNYENDLLPFVVCTSIRDATTAINLLKWGVQDYIEKPFLNERLIPVVKNAIARKSNEHLDETTFSGNIDSIIIPSKQKELSRACNWVEKKVASFFDEHELLHFVNFFNEFLMNAHEHGNMKIDEAEKMKLLVNGEFEETLKECEDKIQAEIQIGITVLKTQLAILITDEGNGFDYVKYVKMSDEDLMEHISWPNGRGIFMSAQYFDAVFYRDKGATVVLIKKIKKL